MKAVIFDLDGTLLDTLEDLADSTNYALCQMGYPKRTIKEVCQFVGNGGLCQVNVGNSFSFFKMIYSI